MIPVRRAVVVLLVAPLLATAGCAQAPTDPSEDRVVGRWEWVRATGGIAGTVRTPATEGFGRQLRFGPDGQVELWRGGELQVRTSYEIRPPSAETGEPSLERVVYGEPLFGWPWQHLVRADAEALVLADPCCDGFQWEFRPAR